MRNELDRTYQLYRQLMDMAKSQGAEYPVLADCSDKSKIIIQDTGGRGQTWIVELMEF